MHRRGDEIAALIDHGVPVHFEVREVAVHDLATVRPRITCIVGGADTDVNCDFIAGCDGFHGICRSSIPSGVLAERELVYPFSWLGILAQAPPSTDELIYAWHDNGFALHSMRSPEVSRLYLQVPNGTALEEWPDDRIWAELEARIGPVNDVRLLGAALRAFHEDGATDGLGGYSRAALRRVWRAQDFSNYMTQLLHDLGDGDFGRRLQLSRLDYIEHSQAAATSLAENYVGLPAEPDF